MQQVIQTGAGIRVTINGSVVGFATGLQFTRGLNSKAIYEIDNPFAKEIMNTVYSVQGTLTGFRIRGSGGLDGMGIMNAATPNAFFNQKYCVIEVVDILSGVVMYTIKKVVFDNDSWTLQNKSIFTFSANFKAVFIQNEITDKS